MKVGTWTVSHWTARKRTSVSNSLPSWPLCHNSSRTHAHTTHTAHTHATHMNTHAHAHCHSFLMHYLLSQMEFQWISVNQLILAAPCHMGVEFQVVMTMTLMGYQWTMMWMESRWKPYLWRRMIVQEQLSSRPVRATEQPYSTTGDLCVSLKADVACGSVRVGLVVVLASNAMLV